MSVRVGCALLLAAGCGGPPAAVEYEPVTEPRPVEPARTSSLDADEDGVPDNDDMCPCAPEDRDQFEDEDGCPDVDNDQDHLLDVCDACPNEPERHNGFDDEDGCPDRAPVVVAELRIEIREDLAFGHGSAQLRANSSELLDRMAEVLNENPNVEQVRVEGHANPREPRPRRLGERRAEAVREALVGRGVDAARLSTQSAGVERPIADNTTEEGRARNRRVDLHVERFAEPARPDPPQVTQPTGPPTCPGPPRPPPPPSPCED